jgi:hypothetical protein
MPTEISHLDKMLLRSYFFSTEYKRLDKFYVPQAFFERWIQQGLIARCLSMIPCTGLPMLAAMQSPA